MYPVPPLVSAPSAIISAVRFEDDAAFQPAAPPEAFVAMSTELDQTTIVKTHLTGLKPWMEEFQSDMPPLPPDPLSNAEPEKAVTTYLKWSVKPDFPNKQLQAVANYRFFNLQTGNDRLVLDVQGLVIEKITVNGEPVETEIEKSHTANKPDGLKIPIPPKKGIGAVEIHYRTTPDATGIFWIDPEFTDGGKHPLVYTLFQPNEGASVIPGQHSPKIRLSYEVNVETGSPDLMALSSVSNNPRERNSSGIYTDLHLQRSVPLYLLSLNVGNFSYRGYKEDSRTGVYAEDAVIDQTAATMRHLPKMLKTAEEMCGHYNWERYEPLIMPWAFPYGAMEHPCMSTCGKIATEQPTIVPHELAHSWTGNDITNGNWREFFWNEGFTTFYEIKFARKLFGEEVANLIFTNMLQDALETMEENRDKNPDVLRLINETDNLDFSRIPYAKGALFFFMLEQAVGEENFDRFAKNYMTVFFSNTMSEERFLSFLQLWLHHEMKISDFETFRNKHQIAEWLHGFEIPQNAPLITSPLTQKLEEQRKLLLEGREMDAALFHGWDIEVQVAFLQQEFALPQLIALDKQLGLTQSKLMTILAVWSKMCAKGGYLTPETKEMIVQFVIKRNSRFEAGKIGAALSKSDEGKELIREILARGKGKLFPITSHELEKKLENHRFGSSLSSKE